MEFNTTKAWTDFATPSLEVLENLEVQMYISSPHYYVKTTLQSFALHSESF